MKYVLFEMDSQQNAFPQFRPSIPISKAPFYTQPTVDSIQEEGDTKIQISGCQTLIPQKRLKTKCYQHPPKLIGLSIKVFLIIIETKLRSEWLNSFLKQFIDMIPSCRPGRGQNPTARWKI